MCSLGLLRQRIKGAERPVYQLFLYFLFWICNNFHPYSSLTGKCKTQNLKKSSFDVGLNTTRPATLGNSQKPSLALAFRK